MADQDPNNNPQHSQNAHDRATWDAVADATAPRLAQHLERMEFQRELNRTVEKYGASKEAAGRGYDRAFMQAQPGELTTNEQFHARFESLVKEEKPPGLLSAEKGKGSTE